MGSFEDIAGKKGPLQLVVLFGGLRCLGTVPQLSRYANGSTKRYFVSVLHIWPENGVDINPGLLSAASEGHEAVVSALLAAGADNNAARQDRATPLYIAAEKGHEAVVSALLASGADKNAALQTGATPLAVAARNGHAAVVSALLTAGADKNAATRDGWTPLSVATHKGFEAVVSALRAAGARTVD